MTEVFSNKPKKNILFKRNFDDTIFKKISSVEELSDNDERVLKEINMMTGCHHNKTKIKKIIAKTPTIEEAILIIMSR